MTILLNTDIMGNKFTKLADLAVSGIARRTFLGGLGKGLLAFAALLAAPMIAEAQGDKYCCLCRDKHTKVITFSKCGGHSRCMKAESDCTQTLVHQCNSGTCPSAPLP